MKNFYDKIDKCSNTGCWNWTGATDPKNGYGRFRFSYTTDDYRRVLELRGYGFEMRAIAEKVGMSPTHVRRIINGKVI